MYHDQTKSKDVAPKQEPHPDVEKNADWYSRHIQFAKKLKPFKIEIGDRQFDFVHTPEGINEYTESVREWRYIRLVWKNERGVNHSTIISFHQEHYSFKVQLCNALNYLGRKRYLIHSKYGKTNPRNDPVNKISVKDDKWADFSVKR